MNDVAATSRQDRVIARMSARLTSAMRAERIAIAVTKSAAHRIEAIAIAPAGERAVLTSKGMNFAAE
jgi:hypothetical protein